MSNQKYKIVLRTDDATDILAEVMVWSTALHRAHEEVEKYFTNKCCYSANENGFITIWDENDRQIAEIEIQKEFN